MGKFVYLNQLSVAAQGYLKSYYTSEGTISESQLEAAVIAKMSNDSSTQVKVDNELIELSSYSVIIAKIVKEKIDRDQSLVGNNYFTETFTPALLDYFYLPKNDPQKFNAAVVWLKTLSSNKPLNKLWPSFFTSQVSSAQFVIDDKIQSNSDTLDVNALAEHAKHHPGILESLLREKPWWKFWGADPVSHKLKPKQLMDLLFIYKDNENFRTKICDLLLRQGYFDSSPFMKPHYDSAYVAMISAAKNGHTLALNLCVQRDNALKKLAAASEGMISLREQVQNLTAASEEVKKKSEELEKDKAKLQDDQEKFSTLKEQYAGKMSELDTQLSSKLDELKTKTIALGEQEKVLAEKQASLSKQEIEMNGRNEQLVQREREIFAKEKSLRSLEEDLKRTDLNLRQREELLNDYDEQKQKEELAKPQNMNIAAPNFSLSSASFLGRGIDKPDFEVDDYDQSNLSELLSNLSTASDDDSDDDNDNILDDSSFMRAKNKVCIWYEHKKSASSVALTDDPNVSPIKSGHMSPSLTSSQ